MVAEINIAQQHRPWYTTTLFLTLRFIGLWLDWYRSRAEALRKRTLPFHDDVKPRLRLRPTPIVHRFSSRQKSTSRQQQQQRYMPTTMTMAGLPPARHRQI